MPSFADLLAASERRPVVLCEMTPSLVLGGFTAVGGAAPNTYQISLPRAILQSSFQGGIYRRCVGVRENNTDLTERASLAQVDANASSWYWDESAELLYVRTSSGADPDTFTAYQAFVTFYFSDTGITLNRTDGNPSTGVYHQPWLIGGAPKLTSEVEDLLFGVKLSQTGDVAFSNAHGFWNTLIARNSDYVWKNKKARFYLGGEYNGQSLLRSEYQPLVTMLIEDVSADELECRFTLKPLAKRLERQVPVTPFFTSTYPNLGDGVEGTKKWIGYGRATIRPDLTDTTVSQGKWTIADAAYQTLFAVHAAYAVHKTTGARTTLTVTVDYTVDLAACTLTVVNATYNFANYYIEVDVTGKPDGAGSYYKTFGTIVKDLLQTFAGEIAADLDTASFTQADIDAPQELSVWLKNPRSLASILATDELGQPSLERSVMGTVQQTLEGKWTVSIFDPGYDSATVTRLRREDFAKFLPEPKLESVFSTTNVYYDKDHSTGNWPVAQATDARVQYLSETQDFVDIYTFLRSSSDALTLAQRFQFIAGGVSLEVEFEERGAKLAAHRAGQKVLVTYGPAPDATGVFTEKAFELVRLDKNFSPVVTIAGRLGDLRGIAGMLGHWVDSAAPDWSAANASERANSGFWSDASGFVDPADGSTRDIRVWW